MNIRSAKASDFDAWASLWKGYQDYYQVDLSASTKNTWQRLMSPPDDGPFCLVCEDEQGVLLGFTTYVYHGHTWQAAPRCYLVDLFIQTTRRGHGIGRALIEAVYAKARTHGCCQVYWLTQDFNKAGRRLYDKVATVTPFIKYQHTV